MRGCVVATGTGMGMRVCLHADELVSEWPPERVWHSSVLAPPLSAG